MCQGLLDRSALILAIWDDNSVINLLKLNAKSSQRDCGVLSLLINSSWKAKGETIWIGKTHVKLMDLWRMKSAYVGHDLGEGADFLNLPL